MAKTEPARILPGSWHHLTQFTAGKSPFLVGHQPITAIQATMNAVRDRFGLRVAAYCILPTQFQWLVQVTAQTIEDHVLAQGRRGTGARPADVTAGLFDRLMRDMRSRAAQALRLADSTLPHELWAAHHWSRPVESCDVPGVIDMIHCAPVQARLAETPGDFRWSSYQHLVAGRPSLVRLDPAPRLPGPEE
ncbi:MAG: hypothetical protein IT323_09555 [Anaerolineae bacterium]|nr:hypothetical protein [Anaerolineae bacterium]